MPITVAEAIRGADGRGADARRHASASASPPGTQHGTRPAAARRGPAAARAARAAATSTTGFVIDDPEELTDRAARGASRSFAEAMNGHDPRASAASRRVRAGEGVTADGRRAAASTTRMHRRTRPQRGVFMISVAAELAEMHPQTLRMYEARGLISPKRSPKDTRLYSQEDVERLRRIQEMTTELGPQPRRRRARARARARSSSAPSSGCAQLEQRSAEMRARAGGRDGAVRRSFRAELVPIRHYDGDGAAADAAAACEPADCRSLTAGVDSAPPKSEDRARCPGASSSAVVSYDCRSWSRSALLALPASADAAALPAGTLTTFPSRGSCRRRRR